MKTKKKINNKCLNYCLNNKYIVILIGILFYVSDSQITARGRSESVWWGAAEKGKILFNNS